MSRNQILTLSLILSLVTVLIASNASAVDPKPSQLVTVVTSAATCSNGPFSGILFDTRANSDGTYSSFSIPAGKVLIITDAAVSATGGVAGHTGELDILALPGASGLFQQAYITIDSGGNMSRQFTFPTGVAVKSGLTPCLFAVDGTTQTTIPTVNGFIHGYFAPDR